MQFTPQSVGALSGTITVTDNTLNQAGTTQAVSLTGTGTVPVYAVTFATDGTPGATLTGTVSQSIVSGANATARRAPKTVPWTCASRCWWPARATP